MLIDSARMKNDSAAIVSIRKTMGMASLFGGVKYKLLSSFVISATRHYWKITDQQNVRREKEMYRLGKLCLSVGSNSGDGRDVRICWKRSGRNKELKSFLNDVLEVIKNNSLSDADPKDIQSVTERVEKM